MTADLPISDLATFLSHLRGGHAGTIGIRFRAHGPDWAEFELPYDPRLVGDVAHGVLASGPVLSLMDMAASASVWARTGVLRPQATLDLRIDYLRPAGARRTIVGRGECVRVARTIAFVKGQAHDGDPDDPLALVAGTFMFTDGERP